MSRADVEQKRPMEAEEAADGPLGRGERRGEGEPARKRERWFWAGCWALSFSSSFLFLFHTQTIQTILFEFK
jgi:hypothetical protein